MVDDIYHLDDKIKYYLDYDKFLRDLQFGGDYWISDEGYIFRNY